MYVGSQIVVRGILPVSYYNFHVGNSPAINQDFYTKNF